METPVSGFFRLSVGQEVRLRHAYVIRCVKVVHDKNGAVETLHCTYDPDTLGKNPEGRKVKGVIHWVSAKEAHPVEFIEYDRLFMEENPARDEDFLKYINPHSMRVLSGFVEPALAKACVDSIFQLERLGYYKVAKENRLQKIVALKDTWGKLTHA